MYEKTEKIEDINSLTMYKMIQALFQYDYYAAKCLVNEFLQKRKDKREIENLKQIQELIFYQKDKELNELLKRVINSEKRMK